MPLDAIVLTALRHEMTGSLCGARIDRISMPERDMLILSVHSRERGSRRVLITTRPGSARIHFTDHPMENPLQPPMFCMLLRKHLLGGRITAIDQPAGERLLILHVDAVDELNCHAEKKLVLELMGKGLNLLLIDSDGRILDCLRRVEYGETGRRALLPGLFYSLPPSQDRPNFLTLPAEDFDGMLTKADRSDEPDRWLQNSFGGLSPLLCRELGQNGWKGLPEAIDALRERLTQGRFTPVMLLQDGCPKDFSFMPIRQYGDSLELMEYPDFSSLLDAFYYKKDQQENMRRRSAELTRIARTARDRLERKISAREQELQATEKREEYRRRGDLITANIFRLKRGMRAFEAQDFYSPGCPVVSIPLDERKSPQQNAAASYKQYNKAKTANRILTELLTASIKEKEYLDTVLDEISRAETDRDLGDIRRELTEAGYIRIRAGEKRQKLPAPRKPLRFLSDSGKMILVGRGNTQNDELTFRTARRGDLWLHVQKIPGSHVIVSQAEGEADEETVRQAAVLAATYSQARDAGRTAVDYTLVRHVKKPSGAKPGQVLYTDYATIVVQADETLADRLRQE